MAKSVVDEFNTLWADNLGYQVDLIGWEETVASYGRPQGTINLDLAQCELVIGMMWKKWGTRPAIAGKYTSGFEEEFRTSVESRKTHGRPEISLYFKSIGSEFLTDPGDDLKKVLSFKAEIIDGKEIYFESFEGDSDFQNKISRCIIRYIQKLRSKEAIAYQAPSESVTEKDSDSAPLAKLGEIARFLPQETTFLKEIITPSKATEALSSVEIARLRLLASYQHSSGNDELNLGVHDANLIYANKDQIPLSRNEIFGLFQSGLSNFKEENTPLWHWLNARFSMSILPMWSRMGPKRERSNAIAAMCAVSFNLPETDRAGTIAYWLGDESSDEIKVEALRYLARMGKEQDLPYVEKEVFRSSYATRADAIKCYIAINRRDGFDKSFKSILHLKNEPIEYSFVEDFAGNAASLSSEGLIEGLTHSGDGVRRISAALLRERGLLSVADAERLLTDEDAETRYEAAMALRSHGTPLSENDAQKMLVKPRASIGSLFGGRRNRDEEGERVFSRFQKHLLGELPDTQLLEQAKSPQQRDCTAYLVWVQRKWSQRVDELKGHVSNRFANFVNDIVEQAAETYGAGSMGAASASEARNEMQRRFTRRALDAIAMRKSRSDLNFIRQELDKDDVEFSISDVEYLEKCGEWEDIDRIIKSTKREKDSKTQSLLMIGRSNIDYTRIGQALYKIGSDRLPELLSPKFDSSIRESVIVSATKGHFSALSNEEIEAIFGEDSLPLRKNACLKTIISLPRRRVLKLLNRYLSKKSHRYYNVIYWLDLGISVSRDKLPEIYDTALKNRKI